MQNIMGDPPIGCQAGDNRPVNCRTFEVEVCKAEKGIDPSFRDANVSLEPVHQVLWRVF